MTTDRAPSLAVRSSAGSGLIADPNERTARIRDIDVIRGAALFGVVWMNLFDTTNAFMPTAVQASLPMARVDRVIASAANG